jgi:hypothetical protein
MSGEEEDILSNRNLINEGKAIDLVLTACCLRLDNKAPVSEPDVLDMFSSDRVTLLYRIREISEGDGFDLPFPCPSCKRKTRLQGTISKDVLIAKAPDGLKNEFEITLPRSGDVVRFRHMNGRDERKLAKINDASFTDQMIVRIVTINSKPPSRVRVKSWLRADRQALRNEMDRISGGPELKEEVVCTYCGATIPVRPDQIPGFLLSGIRGRTPGSSLMEDSTGVNER